MKALPAWSAIPAFEIVCDGRVLDIVRLEPAGDVMRIHVSAPGGRQSGEVPPGSGRVAVESSWGDLDAAIERVRSVAAGAKARAEEAAAQTGHPVDVLAGIRAADALLICDALAEASRRNVRDEDIIMRQFMELQKLREHTVRARLHSEIAKLRAERAARGCADCGKPTSVYCWSCNFARMGGY